MTIIKTRCVNRLEPSSPPPPQQDILIPPILLVSLRSDDEFIKGDDMRIKEEMNVSREGSVFNEFLIGTLCFKMVFVGLESANFVFLFTMNV